MATKEELLEKARAKLQQQKSTTADDPVLVPKTYPPELRTPEIKPVQDTVKNPFGSLKLNPEVTFWCSIRDHALYTRQGGKIQFKDFKAVVLKSDDIAFVRDLCRLYPSRFKEL